MSSNHTDPLSSQTSHSTIVGDPPENETDAEAVLDALRRIAPDQFIKGYETTKWEIWAYYGYHIRSIGLIVAVFAPMAMQNLISGATNEAGTVPFLVR